MNNSEVTMSNNKQQTAVKQFVATFKTSIQIGPYDWIIEEIDEIIDALNNEEYDDHEQQ